MLKIGKKVISLVLVLSLLVSVFAMSASALESGKSFGVILTPDKDVSTLEPGDIVTITGSCEVSDFDTLFGVAKLLLVYDKDVYTPVDGSMEILGDFALFYKDVTPSSLPSTNSNWAKIKDSRLSATEWAYYDTACVLNFAADTTKDWNEDGVNNTAKAGYQMTPVEDGSTVTVDQFKIQFEFKGDAGTSRNIFITDAFGTKVSAQYFKTTNGSTATNMDTSVVDVEYADIIVNAPVSEFIPLTVTHWKDQIRFDKVGGTGVNKDKYAGTFDYRMLATIDNFEEVIGTNYDMVTDVGFIFNKGAAIDVDAAKAQVENGVVGGTYTYVRDVYVSTAYQGETYVISCLVNNIADAEKTTVLSSMAYVEYVVDGVTYYAYSAVKTSNFEGLYNEYYSKNFGA